MKRTLTRQERDLWDRLRQEVTPLKRQPPPPDPRTKKSAATAQARAGKSEPAIEAPPLRRAPRAVPALSPLDQKTRRQLARGAIAVDARIDLHGMRRARALPVLMAFLKSAQSRGDRVVLIVTGKGDSGAKGTGVLRREVPEWLARPELREQVVGFAEASPRHGGGGALYVRIRRRQKPRASPTDGA